MDNGHFWSEHTDALIELAETEISEVLHRGRRSLVCRAMRGTQKVVLKTSAAERPDPGELSRLERERQLGQSIDSPRVVRPTSLVRAGHRLVLIMPDHGLQALSVRPRPRLPMDLAVRIAVGIAEALADMHASGVVHRDINPSNVLWDWHAMDLRLIDLGIASRAPRELRPTEHPRCLEGTLPYLSPEQTGRTGHPVDHRTDYYSLGATLYELLSGRPPFDAGDPLELIHCHIARPPPPIPGIPERIATVLGRLLAKSPEERFCSSAEIVSGLTSESSTLAPPPLRIEIPNKVYGRDRELDSLRRAFELASTGPRVLVALAGEAGIGKSALVAELHKLVIARGAWFGAGKFDQLQRDQPYSALLEAFRDVVRQKLTEPDDKLEHWTRKLRDQLRDDAGFFGEWIPELGLLFPARIRRTLPQDAARARFTQVVRALIASFAGRESPLVMLIDDVQWADGATLGLLENVLSDEQLGHLLVICTYRDTEIDAAHSTYQFMQQNAVETVTLGGLDHDALTAMLRDLAISPEDECPAIARRLATVTGGNPLFVRELIRSLQENGTLDRSVFDNTEIPDDVAPLLVARLDQLEAGPNLSLAACIGMSFELATLSRISGVEPGPLARSLVPAMQAGVITAMGDGMGRVLAGDDTGVAICRFAHDRVQQAAYESLDQTTRAATRGALARRLLAQLGPAEVMDRVFEIADHVNVGATMFTERDDRERAARVNLAAAEHARRSSAHAIARRYATAGLEFLPETASYQMRFALEYEQCRAACATAAPLGELESMWHGLGQRAQTRLERAQVAVLQVARLSAIGHHERAIALALPALEALGVDLLRGDPAEELREAWQALTRRVGTRPFADVIAQTSASTDPEHVVLDELFASVGSSLWATRPELLRLICVDTAARTLDSGVTAIAPEILSAAGFVAAHVVDDYERGYELAEAALALARRLNVYRGAARHLAAYFLLWFQRPFRDCADQEARAFHDARTSGNVSMACHAAAGFCAHQWRGSVPLAELLERTRPFIEYMVETGYYYRDGALAMRQSARTLIGPDVGEPTLSDQSYDQDQAVRTLQAEQNQPGIRMHYLLRGELLFIHGDFAAASRALELARRYVDPGEIAVLDSVYYWALATARTPAADAEHVAQAASYLTDRAERVVPDNLANRATLVAAEAARLRGDIERAAALFDRAVELSRRSGLLRDEAVAAEAAARFYGERGLDGPGTAFLRVARNAYQAWGAASKVAQLDRTYPSLAGDSLRSRASESANTDSERLDHATIDFRSLVKASQNLSAEMDIERLTSRFLAIVSENIGAEHAELILIDDGAEIPAYVPGSIVQFVKRTREPVSLGGTSHQALFRADPTIQRRDVRSVLCLPLLAQGELIGVLYCENTKMAGVFGPERVEIAQILSAQAAISLHNARLYESLTRTSRQVQQLNAELARERDYLREEIRATSQFGDIIGTSPALQRVLAQIEAVAKTRASVLILGESGVGKELIARAIHERSPRSRNPLVKVNCASIPKELFESEFFGHKQGSFTGALKDREGRFQLADGGTIFLDEVGEIPLDLQSKLLRVLQEQEFERVGDDRTRTVDVRIIAATNRDLRTQAAEGRFRQDLYYRLSVFPVEVPPLRERHEDIVPLAMHFLACSARELNTPAPALSRDVAERLERYPWPGNIRELQNVMERAAILADGRPVNADMLALMADHGERGSPVSMSPPRRRDTRDDKLVLDRAAIVRALDSNRGIVARAARELGLSRQTLYRRMKELGVEPPRRSSRIADREENDKLE